MHQALARRQSHTRLLRMPCISWFVQLSAPCISTDLVLPLLGRKLPLQLDQVHSPYGIPCGAQLPLWHLERVPLPHEAPQLPILRLLAVVSARAKESCSSAPKRAAARTL
jgi:hypothetical protein